ncbi:peptide methionine sulfoxide reductase [Centruroides vittatus]|uniref:peptide methionine sulfoxide reductase n=1 Tax=Centruroides vittatus TaxID=120091 RepID=UPI00350EBC90
MSYQELLDMFWKLHDPTTCHKRQYMSAIFYHDEEQKKLAEESKAKKQKVTSREIVTKILPMEKFYEAEDYHQKYILRNYDDIFDTIGLDGKALINSHAAARINGYLGGYGKKSDFEKEWKTLGLSEEVAEMILDEMKRNRRLHC